MIAVSEQADAQSLPRFVSLRSAAKLYGLPNRTFERLVAKGAVPRGTKIGGRRMFSVAVIERHLAALEAAAGMQSAAG